LSLGGPAAILYQYAGRTSQKKRGDTVSSTIAKDNATDVVKALVEHAKTMRNLQHRPTQGELKELGVSEVLKQFLTSQFEVGTGVIVNRDGTESRQTDIVVYDNRIIPPIIEKNGRGVYPIESVVATVSVRTELDGGGLSEADEAATHLLENVFAGYHRGYSPVHAVLGFSGGIEGLSCQETGQAWLREHVHSLFDICITGRYCWADVGTKGWTIGTDDSGRYNETKRFLALLLDNIRTHAEMRYSYFISGKHLDWFSRYIRD